MNYDDLHYKCWDAIWAKVDLNVNTFELQSFHCEGGVEDAIRVVHFEVMNELNEIKLKLSENQPIRVL